MIAGDLSIFGVYLRVLMLEASTCQLKKEKKSSKKKTSAKSQDANLDNEIEATQMIMDIELTEQDQSEETKTDKWTDKYEKKCHEDIRRYALGKECRRDFMDELFSNPTPSRGKIISL